MNRKLLTSILLCAVFLLSMGTTFAMPSADAYETVVQSLPPLGARVTADSFPSFAEVVPNHPMVPPQVARGTYGGWEFMEQICHHPPRGRRTRHHSDRRGDPLCHFGDLRRSLSLHGRWKISLGAWRLRR